MKQSELFLPVRLTDDQVNFYRKSGYLKLGRTLTNAGLATMLKQCMTAWEQEKEEYHPGKSWLQNALLVNIHQKSEVVKEFYFNGPVVDAMEQLIGPNIKGVTSQLTFKMKGNTKPFGWHQDNGYGELEPYTAISTLTALEDTDQENGCLRIIPRSHAEGQIDVADTFNAETKSKQASIDLTVDESKAIPMPMKAGETLVFHCWTLHQSQGNHSTTRDRRILFMRYADADAVEVYNDRRPRLGKLLRGTTIFPEVAAYDR